MSEESALRATVFRRAHLPPGSPLEHLLDRLERLQGRGVLDRYTVEEWPARASVMPAAGCEAVDRFERIERIASHLGVEIAPSFERYVRHNALAGVTEQVLVFPTIGILVSGAEGDPVALAPCSTGGQPCHVEDIVARLEGSDSAAHRALDFALP